MTALTPALRQDYEQKWATCEIDYQKPAVMAVAKRVLAVKQTCSGFWSIPWWFVALCWLRECNLDPKGNLANGQRFDRVTTIVPIGRGPFLSWRDAAQDALKLQGYNKITNWDVATTLNLFEGFNGYGYRAKGVPSPYLWSHTNKYSDGPWDNDPRGGKYYADHKWSADIYDAQIGVCAVLKCLMEMDPAAVHFGMPPAKAALPPYLSPPPPDVPKPVPLSASQLAAAPKPAPQASIEPKSVGAAKTVVAGTVLAGSFGGGVMLFQDHPIAVTVGAALAIALAIFLMRRSR